MVPDTEAVCQTSEIAVDTSGDTYEKIKDRPEKEVASVTAWKRYQRLVAAMESQGGEFNRKSLIEAIFRGSDLVYASHWSTDRSNISCNPIDWHQSASIKSQWRRTRVISQRSRRNISLWIFSHLSIWIFLQVLQRWYLHWSFIECNDRLQEII